MEIPDCKWSALLSLHAMRSSLQPFFQPQVVLSQLSIFRKTACSMAATWLLDGPRTFLLNFSTSCGGKCPPAKIVTRP